MKHEDLRLGLPVVVTKGECKGCKGIVTGYFPSNTQQSAIVDLGLKGSWLVPSMYLEEVTKNVPKNLPKDNPHHDIHYQTAHQPIEVMQANMTHAELIGFLKGNIIKYACRCGRKDDALKEADKIKRYAAWLVDVLQGKTIDPRK